MLKALFALAGAWLCVAATLHGETPEVVPALAEVFTRAQVKEGTFATLEVASGRVRVSDAALAEARYVPASTFKIANALIGLQAGAVRDVEEVLPYGGKPQPFKEWEHDMSLREAMRLSAVPIYQELARRIGLERMAAGVKALGYGNAEIGTKVDHFWLEGPLKISAVEQTQFLARLVRGTLPLRPEVMVAVREITLREQTPQARLHYKTGWLMAPGQPQTGWIVGWVERGQAADTFALHIEMRDASEAPKRLVLAKECLKVLGLWK